jgi:hypothetical protein
LGSIALSASPPAGSSFTTTRCYYDDEYEYPCTSEPKFTFSVLFDRDVAAARVYVTFHTADGQKCADASTEFGPLTAGVGTALTTFTVNVNCELPVQTTRMVATVLNKSSDPPELLTQLFTGNYMFLPQTAGHAYKR